ncbi:MAG: ribosome maturation factor RimP [Thermoleophilaceae bacterium]
MLRPLAVLEVGFAAHLFFDLMQTTDHLQTDIEGRLADVLPQVELLACEPIGSARLRLVIDHPAGVTLGLCEQVTRELTELLEQFALEVASPGPERPLTRPEHFRRFIGHAARVRMTEPRDGRGSFTGELVEASEEEITLAAPEGMVTIAYEDVARANLQRGEES